MLQHGKNYVWTQVTPHIKGKVHALNLTSDLKVMAHPRKHFKVGQGYNAHVVKVIKEDMLELSFVGEHRNVSFCLQSR